MMTFDNSVSSKIHCLIKAVPRPGKVSRGRLIAVNIYLEHPKYAQFGSSSKNVMANAFAKIPQETGMMKQDMPVSQQPFLYCKRSVSQHLWVVGIKQSIQHSWIRPNTLPRRVENYDIISSSSQNNRHRGRAAVDWSVTKTVNTGDVILDYRTGMSTKQVMTTEGVFLLTESINRGAGFEIFG
ncbi:hypothetical protein NPIL_591221 [Nephila pilipes]|uniref:Uncharacterized protein n=1 Tax=Nephila pilipes TaxID=299642 RepID=A0A8X6UII0_NEPPI|nr:hypothetical protein NPIL_591221 [Nephila pilipes]